MSNQWKIDKDPFYSEIYWQNGQSAIEEAGFFYDAATKEDSIKTFDALCTPLAFLNTKVRNPAVLLTTGSFCPIHDGHIQMMESAKVAVEKAGYTVIGGYFSPGHDEYIRHKTGDDWIPIHCRIQIIKEAIKDRPWLNVDPWEGVFNKVAVNFTEVIHRLDAYIKKHTGREIPIFFVCGSDNARFAHTFRNRGYCVVVERPPYDDNIGKHYIQRIGRILYTTGGVELSSTKIRTEHKFTMPTAKNLSLRIESSNEDLPDGFDIMATTRLSSYFKKVEEQYVNKQKTIFNKTVRLSKIPIISIDASIPGDYNLEISRLYDLFGNSMLNYTNRPGSPTIDQQLDAIPKGSYVLYDDDVHTGNTLRFAKSLLEPRGIKVESIASLTISEPKDGEVLDAKDFIFGFNRNAGLVIRLPNDKQVRVPYMYPYTCPFVRASINSPLEFSIMMWELNMHLHEWSPQLRVKDVDYVKDFCNYIGFNEDALLYDVCKHHYEMLISVKS